MNETFGPQNKKLHRRVISLPKIKFGYHNPISSNKINSQMGHSNLSNVKIEKNYISKICISPMIKIGFTKLSLIKIPIIEKKSKINTFYREVLEESKKYKLQKKVIYLEESKNMKGSMKKLKNFCFNVNFYQSDNADSRNAKALSDLDKINNENPIKLAENEKIHKKALSTAFESQEKSLKNEENNIKIEKPEESINIIESNEDINAYNDINRMATKYQEERLRRLEQLNNSNRDLQRDMKISSAGKLSVKKIIVRPRFNSIFEFQS